MQNPPILIAIACLIVLVSAMISGMMGFGFGLVLIPAMILLLSPRLVVPVSILLGMLSRLMLGYQLHRQVSFRRVMPLSLAAVVGAVVGATVFAWLDPRQLKLLVGSVIVVLAVVLLVGLRLPFREGRMAYLPVGLLTGLLQGSTGMGGPPVVLFFANQRMDKEQTRADLTAVLIIVSLAALVAQVIQGMISLEVLHLTAWLAPATVVGTLLGVYLAKYVSNETFRRITLCLILLTGVTAVISTL